LIDNTYVSYVFLPLPPRRNLLLKIRKGKICVKCFVCVPEGFVVDGGLPKKKGGGAAVAAAAGTTRRHLESATKRKKPRALCLFLA
jgi:hypothetical protein